jgi:putative FmdB family regulatory protein
MPTYEYQCDACGHAFEQFHSMSADPVKKCPVCGKNKVRRLIGTGAGLIFKGSGFYITDYRDAGYKNSAKADAPPEAAKDAKPAASSAEGASTTDSKKSGDSKSAESKPAADAKTSAAPKSESKPAPRSEPKRDGGGGGDKSSKKS